jgi:alanyl-tRNA synthetase
MSFIDNQNLNMMTSNEIRQSFLDFFKSKEHHIVPSAPVVPQDDPTLLFTNAGMNQFKDIFLGTRKRQYARIADSQKCIRVSGKHNDLEEVGRDTYHHTFFEMLGNWSFGDYFKAEAIQWAWELFTEAWKLPKDRLWATVFMGDDKDGVPADDEAAEVWRNRTDIDPAHILRFSKKDNFWEMGETGPCGPCSEIHIDRGPGYCDNPDPKHVCEVNAGCARFIELWNLVFIQYNRDEKGKLLSLPAKHVDTGAGFERIVAVMQNKASNYDIDLFQPIINEIGAITGQKYGQGEIGVAFRVLCDHIRALSFAIADGAIPGNEGRGYVLRRILRRAARFGRVLGMREPFIFKLVAPLVEAMGDAYPELKTRHQYISRVIHAEEESFGRTLDRGIDIFEEKAQKIISAGKNIFPGTDAFLLHDTYGFPLDLTQLMAREKNLKVDEKGFDCEMEIQRERSSKSREVSYQTLDIAPDSESGSEFVGYDMDETESEVLHYEDGRLVLKRTPFYAESGGQVGDKGIIVNDSFEFIVEDTRNIGEHIVHLGKLSKGKPPKRADRVNAKIDRSRRRATERNHTVTHLLHKALRTVLGEHVHQAGSLVQPDHMRFDFTHFEKLSQEELEQIVFMVNEKILENRRVNWQIVPFARAGELGAMALFGEKYGDEVRMVEVDGYSRELCGGTHVRATGEIGQFIVTSESSVAAGIRRIESLTGLKTLEYLREKEENLNEASQLLNCRPDELGKRLENLLSEHKKAESELSKLRQYKIKGIVEDKLKQATSIDGVKIISTQVPAVDVEELKVYADLFRDAIGSGVIVSGTSIGDKVNFVCAVTKDLVESKKLNAGNIVKEVAAIAGGSGGGSPHIALAGAKNVDKLDAALSKVEEIVRSKLL